MQTPNARTRARAERKGHNVAAVALANKLARVEWRVWRDQRPFELRDPRQGGDTFHRAACAITTMASGLTGVGTGR
jgi:hypothetical protein